MRATSSLLTGDTAIPDIYDLSAHGANGDAASTTAAWNDALAHAAKHPGTVIHFPSGTWHLNSSGAEGFDIPGGTTIQGASLFGTILRWNDEVDGTTLFRATNASNIIFRDLMVRGQWDALGNSSSEGYPFLLYAVDGLRFERVGSHYSRVMGIAVRNSSNVLVSECDVQYCGRDGISISSSTDISILNNTLRHIDDDAIAAHSSTGEPKKARDDIVVAGNRIFDGQGIRILSARKASIIGNVVDNVRGIGINVQTVSADGSGFEEGTSSGLAISITGNIITNVINRENVDGLNSGCDYILITGDSARPGTYKAVPGLPDPKTGDIKQPYFELNANSASRRTPTAPTSGIIINANYLGRTIPVTDGTDERFKRWSDLGLGEIFTRTGPKDPSLNLGDIVGTGVHLYNGVIRDTMISNNQFVGLWAALIVGDGADLGDVIFSGNVVTDMTDYGVLLNGSGKAVVSVLNNKFDLDPYLARPSRDASTGGWAEDYGPEMFHVQSGDKMSGIITGNIFRNAYADSNVPTDGSTGRWLFQNNIAQCDPVTVGRYDPRNLGIGVVRTTGGTLLQQMESNPKSSDYGQVLTSPTPVNHGVPTSGKWLAGQVVWNGGLGPASPYAGFLRATVGTGATLGTDWVGIPALVGGDLRIPAGSKIRLDVVDGTWIQQCDGKVVIGTTINGADERLLSIDIETGNIVARGTITSGGSP